jgi:tRNA-specific adenosine deaminase 3
MGMGSHEEDSCCCKRSSITRRGSCSLNQPVQLCRVLTYRQIPVAAFVAAPYEDQDNPASMTFTAWDSRNSTAHPLRHAILNVTRRLADYRANPPVAPSRQPSITEAEESTASESSGAHNGQNYLLTSLSLFITHEPCIMCSMALIHSRVKEVFYLHPMPQTGGCGSGKVCLPTLKGVNHRFGICQWKALDSSAESIQIDGTIDA